MTVIKHVKPSTRNSTKSWTHENWYGKSNRFYSVKKIEICFSALKTWQSAMKNSLSEDIDLNGITGFCVRQSNNNPENHYLYIRTDTLAAHGCSYSIVWNI